MEITSNTYLFISIETYHSINPSRISILSTSETKEQRFDDKYFKDYPLIIPDYPSDEKYFVDTTIINNTMTKGFGADFDGDTISLRAVYTVEANQEAEKLINSKLAFLNQSGSTTRILSNESVQALYTLTC